MFVRKKCLLYLGTLNFSKRFISSFFYNLSDKQESYFSAIGGSSDKPPPDLKAEQVSEILRRNEFFYKTNSKIVKKIESNQLSSNSPIEDRLRIAKLNSKVSFKQTNDKEENNLKNNDDSYLFAVFDGHGGEVCADVVAERLFNYIALAVFNFKSNKNLIEPVNIDYLKNLSTDKFQNLKKKVLEEILIQPNLFNSESSSYRSQHLNSLKNRVNNEEKENLVNFAISLQEKPILSIEDAIHRSFLQCDIDISNEIKKVLTNPASNIEIHYYLSLAVSGCCVNLIYIDGKNGYVASSGDCKAVLGISDDNYDEDESKVINLSIEHDSDNLKEIQRLRSNHPKEEHNFLLKNNRLLGQLMPLRAFGDFCYKWSIEDMKKYGLTKAFGSHIIPPRYYTPPYLIVDPEIIKFEIDENDSKNEKFIVLATDGLWEQFSDVRQIIKTVVGHKSQINNKTLENDIFDHNSATYLIRTALGQTYLQNFDAHILTEDILKQQHERLVSFLTLPKSVVRNFRDDISLIVIYL